MATDSAQTLAEQILSAPEGTWKKLRQALKVKTRPEAVELINTDEEAAGMAQSILTQGSALTNASPRSSALTMPIPVGKPPKVSF